MDDLSLITDWGAFRETASDAAEEGTILIYGAFCRELEEIVLMAIHTAIKHGFSKVTLLINSRGGDDRCYAAIVAVLRQYNLKTRGVVDGCAESNAAYLLQRCDARVAFFTSTIMLHWGIAELNNRQLGALIRGEHWPIDDVVTFYSQEVQAILERSGLTVEQFADLADNERVLCAKTAFGLGLLDEVID